MSISLGEALAQVDLKAGQIYRCEVKGRNVEVKVFGEGFGSIQQDGVAESDIMLDPWIELPLPSGTFKAMATLGTLPVEAPEIPAEETP